MTFESWGHTTAQLLFKWKADELKVNPSVTEGLNQHSTFVKFIDRTYGTNFSTGNDTQQGYFCTYIIYENYKYEGIS